MGDRRELRNSFLLGLALTTFSLALHFAPVWVTMLNRGAQTWDGQPLTVDHVEQIVQEHASGNDLSFRRRPLTNWCIDALVSAGFTPKVTFIFLSGLFFLISGMLVFRLAGELGATPAQALTAQAFFHLSPTVLFAWFDPMYTYDEPIQYAAFLAAMLAALHEKTWLCIGALTVALIAHETSILVFTPFILLFPPRTRRNIAIIGMPVLLFAIFLAIYLPLSGIVNASANDALSRFGTLAFNFQNPAMTGETIACLALALVLPCFLIARYQRSDSCTPKERVLVRAFWISVVVNTIVVMVAAKARETRVLALPMLIVWPLMGKVFAAELHRHQGIERFLSFLKKPLWLSGFVVLSIAIHFGIHAVFQLSTGIQQDNLFHEYLIVELLIIAACLLADTQRERRPIT